MYKFKRNIHLEDRSIEMWFGLTSKSRDRHSNFTLYLLTEGPDSPFSYAEQIKSGINSKSEAERYAIKYAKDLLRQLLEQERRRKTRRLHPMKFPASTSPKKQTSRLNLQTQ